ncbi:MAG: hypothetical protein HGB26_07150, partial [Desulfobulbaceae bacterium]|nr:hypothetical protein [Desulfobulbaceae bacterium]
MKSWTPPTNEMIEKALASVKKETDRQYFFSKLKNPLWVEPLRKRGYFNNPPGLKQLPDGYVQFPHWPELSYLLFIAEEVPDQVVEIILSLPKTDNQRVYYDVLAIALKLKGKNSAKMLPKLIEYIKLDNLLLAYRFPELLQHWTSQGNIAEALEIAKLLIEFRKDPREKEKRARRKQDTDAWNTLLEPKSRFEKWEYQEILEKGVRPLAEHEPYQAAHLLIDAVASMIRLGIHPEDFEKSRNEDYSEIWCRRLDKSDRDYQDVKEILVHTLTYAGKQVYEKAPEAIDTLVQALKKNRWKIFVRLRQYLFALYLSDKTLPWIHELILEHEGYSRWKHHYEFQLMIRRACEYFGSRLLSEIERKGIFDAILNGPKKDDFREWMGEQYSEEAFQQHQRNFHRVQLRPFATLLTGEVRSYFDELEGEAQAEIVSDDSYSPYSGFKTGIVRKQSPKSVEDLERFTDQELLTYLNDWDKEHRVKDDWLTEVTIAALVDVFQTIFKGKIIPDSERLTFWMKHRDKIARPIYVAAMVKAMQETVKEKKLDNLNQWIEFCAWVLSHPDSMLEKGQQEARDESRDHPDWRSSRQAVVDFIETCVNKDTNTPIVLRAALADLLHQV